MAAALKTRLERLEQRARNPFARDPTYLAARARLAAGGAPEDFTDAELDAFISWAEFEGPSLAALSDEDLEAIAHGDTRVLTRYRGVTP